MRSGRTQRTDTPTGRWSDRPFVDEASSALASIASRPGAAASHERLWRLEDNPAQGQDQRIPVV